MSWIRRVGLLTWIALLLAISTSRVTLTNDHSTVVRAEDGQLLSAYLNSTGKWRLPISNLEAIKPLTTTFIAKEDKFFLYHPGVNPFAVMRALLSNLLTGRRVSGASTITMQVARLTQPGERNLSNKASEAFRALCLEWRYSKEEILTHYLERLPYGGNIEGVSSASLLLINTDPSKLTPAQIATLCAVPNRPTSLPNDPSSLLKARNEWLGKLQKPLGLNALSLKEAQAQPLEFQRRALPRLAPHLSANFQKTNASQEIQTTLSLTTQKTTEAIVKAYAEPLAFNQVSNASALVVENATGEVKAYVGSKNFQDFGSLGQVDGIQSVRSPGSALKPFIYAMGFDSGFITPSQILYDIPSEFEGYAPKNYDDQFHGKVTVTHALANSLNIPAVLVLEQLGTRKAWNRLSSCGCKTLEKQGPKLGLSMALGGCGVSLWELVGLYRSLARGGVYSPLKTEKGKSTSTRKTRLCSAGSAFLTTEILAQLNRPDLPNNFQNAVNAQKIAWKTGTSYGRRDAWAIGYTPLYTVGVWLGNFDGQGAPIISGADLATPLLFKIFERLPSSSKWFTQPASVRFRPTCLHSGKAASDECPIQRPEPYLSGDFGYSSQKQCQHSIVTWVNPARTISYCRDCKPDFAIAEKRVNEPRAYLVWLSENSIGQIDPPHNPACKTIANEDGFFITSPVSGKLYLVEKEGSSLSLSAKSLSDAGTLSWYANGIFVGQSPSGKSIPLEVRTGDYAILCEDERGRKARVSFRVETP